MNLRMIRPIKPHEIETVLAWHFRNVDSKPGGRQAFAKNFPGEYARINDVITGRRGQVFVAEESGVPVGYIGVALDTTTTPAHAEVCGLYVVPRHRRQGHGRALAEEVVQAAKKEGAGSLSVEVGLREQWLIDFYTSVGFMPASMNMHQKLK